MHHEVRHEVHHQERHVAAVQPLMAPQPAVTYSQRHSVVIFVELVQPAAGFGQMVVSANCSALTGVCSACLAKTKPVNSSIKQALNTASGRNYCRHSGLSVGISIFPLLASLLTICTTNYLIYSPELLKSVSRIRSCCNHGPEHVKQSS